MPDTTRTSQGRIDELARELVRVARIGLLTGRLVAEREQLPVAFGLRRVKDGTKDVDEQAQRLVQLVIDAVGRMPGEQLSAEADAHFGVQGRYRDSPYDVRRGMAQRIWDPDDARRAEGWGYTRREFLKLRQELAATMLELDAESSSVYPSVKRVTLADEKPKRVTKRLECRLESWLTGRGQQQTRSNWTVTDVVVEGRLTSIRSRRHSRYAHHLEPLTPTVRSVENLGVDNYGYTVWQVNFRDELEVGEKFTWGTSTVYDEILPDRIEETDWVVITNPHEPPADPIPHGTVIVHFDRHYLPYQVVRVSTPQKTLPRLVGPVKDIPVSRQGVARAEFEGLEAGQTYGIYWWPQPRPSDELPR